MESTMVIKVKYGDTLRRFNARVDEHAQLDLNMAGLRSKILGLFNFPPDSDITMTYVDEDGDIITLVEDADLSDVMKQRLKFLRIDVLLSGQKGANDANSSGASTPLRSPQVPNSPPSLDASVSEALKFMPEPLRETVVDLASKATSSNPALRELVDSISKFGQSFMSPNTQSQSDAYPTTGNGTSEAPVDPAVKEPVSVDATPVQPRQSGYGPKIYAPVARDVHVKGKSDGFGASSSAAEFQSWPAPKPSDAAGGNWPTQECPFSGVPLENGSTVPPFHRRRHPFKRSLTIGDVLRPVSDAFGGVFHKGVCCDGCGAHPIIGPRYKSNLKADYDLCSVCYAKMGGAEGDYIRMDRPSPYHHHRHPRLCKGIYNHTKHVLAGSPVSRKCGLKSLHPRLDSRFISDVTVMDGTLMAPSTPFTKIWRMRNNGNFVWPRGTQLLWIGGDKLTDVVSVELEILENGVPLDGQIDIAVDFTAPELPGRYISYWRMATSSGHKFGQRVWVQIQVDASLEDSVCSDLGGLNLNLPSDNGAAKGPEINEGDVKPVVDGALNKERDSLNSVGSEQPKHDQEVNTPVNSILSVGHGASSPSLESLSRVSYPLIDMSEAAVPEHPMIDVSGATLPEPSFVPFPVVESPALPVAPKHPKVDVSGATLPRPSFVAYPVVESPGSPVALNDNNVVEQTLLKELEEMGFQQVDLNKEILRNNEYNLEQSVDQLCGVDEWDPMLEELEEMGFCDTEMNKRLLKKNNGSIKYVVMDLINGHKE